MMQKCSFSLYPTQACEITRQIVEQYFKNKKLGAHYDNVSNTQTN